MDNNSKEKNKSLRRAVTAEKLTEMLREIDISAAVENGGEYTASARLTALFDHGTFSRIGAYVNRSSDPDAPAGVICGYGAVGGRLVYAFAEDRARMGGALDSASLKLVRDLYALAMRNGAPIVGIFDSAGATVYEGASMLASIGRLMSTNSSASGIIPRIAIVPGACGGSNAVLASSFDFLLTVKSSEIYAVPPFVSGCAAAPALDGLSAYEAEDEASLFRFTRTLLSFIPSNNREGTAVDSEISEHELNRAPKLKGMCGEAVISEISDGKKYVRLFSEHAPEVAVGFFTIGGISCAFVSSERSCKDGALTPAACNVIAKLQKFADAFAMPLVVLVDCPGFDNGISEQSLYLEAASRLTDAMCNSQNPKVSVVMGRAYGAGFIYMASKAFGADIAFALDDACISALAPESSVAFLWNDRINEGDLTSSREQLEEKWREEHASPNEAALCGEIDDILSSSELRPRLVSALHMLLGKTTFDAVRRKR